MRDLTAVLPTLVLAVWGVGLLLADLVMPRERRAAVGWLGLPGLGLAFAACAWRWGEPASGFDGAVVLDNYGLLLDFIFIIVAALTVLLSLGGASGVGGPGYYSLLLFSASGLTLAAGANDLLILFVALELFSLPLYVLAALGSRQEAALKYFLLGAFASALMVYGIALLYGASGATTLPSIVTGANQELALAGAGLILAALAFRMAAVPFQAWTLVIYGGAPTPIAAFVTLGNKAAGLAALGRLFWLALSPLGDDWAPVLAGLAALAMLGGSVAALSQSDVRRTLACTSIAHGGLLLMGLAARNEHGLAAALFYLLAYVLAHQGAWAGLAVRQRATGRHRDGAATAWLAALLFIFALSLAGLPPSGGFVGRYYLFWAASEADMLWLAAVGALASLLLAFSYLRVVVTVYSGSASGLWTPQRLDLARRGLVEDRPEQDLGEASAELSRALGRAVRDSSATRSPALLAALVLATVGTLVLGLWPGPLLEMTHSLF